MGVASIGEAATLNSDPRRANPLLVAISSGSAVVARPLELTLVAGSDDDSELTNRRSHTSSAIAPSLSGMLSQKIRIASFNLSGSACLKRVFLPRTSSHY